MTQSWYHERDQHLPASPDTHTVGPSKNRQPPRKTRHDVARCRPFNTLRMCVLASSTGESETSTAPATSFRLTQAALRDRALGDPASISSSCLLQEIDHSRVHDAMLAEAHLERR